METFWYKTKAESTNGLTPDFETGEYFQRVIYSLPELYVIKVVAKKKPECAFVEVTEEEARQMIGDI